MTWNLIMYAEVKKDGVWHYAESSIEECGGTYYGLLRFLCGFHTQDWTLGIAPLQPQRDRPSDLSKYVDDKLGTSGPEYDSFGGNFFYASELLAVDYESRKDFIREDFVRAVGELKSLGEPDQVRVVCSYL